MRFYIYFLIIAILISLMFYSLANYDKYYPSLDNFHDNPEKYRGFRAENCGIMLSKENEGFVLRAGLNSIFVKYDMSKIRHPILGTVCVVGTYNNGNYIDAEIVSINDFIFVKYFLSSLSIFYVIFIFFSEWKFTKRGFKSKRMR